MENKITKTPLDIMDDAPGVAMDFYNKIESFLEKKNGKEFVENNPKIIAELASASMNYYASEMHCKTMQQVAEVFDDKAFVLLNKLDEINR